MWFLQTSLKCQCFLQFTLGELVRCDEPSMRGSTPLGVAPPGGQANLVGLAGADEVPKLAAPAVAGFPANEPRREAARDAGGRCG